ncbi:MAG: PEP-CTERM sorting domain-containing protein, partial [Candidatus Omnitrophota bacterium]
IVGPEETFSVYGRFYNNSTAGEVYGIGQSFELGYWFYSWPGMQSRFDEELTTTLKPFIVEPGESLDFVWGIHRTEGSLASGPMTSQLELTMLDHREYPFVYYGTVTRYFYWTVSEDTFPGDGGTASVPEPATLSLLGLGLLGLVFRRKKAR